MSARKPCCDGIEAINAKLKEFNATLVTNLLGPTFTTLATCKLRDGVRAKKPPIIIASFCPFCGTAYPKAAASPPSESVTEQPPAPPGLVAKPLKALPAARSAR